jgi:hypothetical protein
LTEDASVNKLTNVIGVQNKKGDAYEARVQADRDSILEYALPRFQPLLNEMIALPCRHQSQGNCSSCLDMKIKNGARWAAEQGWKMTKQYGHLALSEENRKLMG